MNIQKEYDVVNAMLRLLGGAAIAMPKSGTDREKMQHLFDSYLAFLMTLVPRYKGISDPRMIPDMILVQLFKTMDRMD